MKRSIQYHVSLILITILLFVSAQPVFASLINNHGQENTHENIFVYTDDTTTGITGVNNLVDIIAVTTNKQIGNSDSRHCDSSFGSGSCDMCNHCVSFISRFSLTENRIKVILNTVFNPSQYNTDLPNKDRPPRTV